MAFRTTLEHPSEAFPISYTDSILSMGSCFAVHMAERLAQRKFNIQNNPFGILYNPISIAQNLELLASERTFSEVDLFEYQSLWHSFAHHGAFSAPSPTDSLDLINTALQQARAKLQQTNTLILTLGTAFVWKEKETQNVVANCHKLPANNFTRTCCTVDEIVAALSKVVEAYQEINPSLRCLISVSPVRHLRDGMVNNQLSKASLILAAHTLTKKLANVFYFPAYEMMMDDLRDYRFYNSDMLHPSALAVDYIWSFFQQHFFQENTLEQIHAIERILKAVQHRPLYPDSLAQQQFKAKTLQQITLLEQKYPDLSFLEEKEKLK
ncbi:MAG: GSCFA domain-containing protein [Saprospiraceae bacterium]